MAGRKKLSELDKAKSKASRLYWKHQDTLTAGFEDEHIAKELQFSKYLNQMGRPPILLSIIQSRALDDYSDSLKQYRKIEQNEGVKAASDNEMINYKKSDRAGRKSKDEVLHIKKYIRRTQRQIDDIKAQEDSDFAKVHKGPGRHGSSKAEKIELYQKRISDAEAEIEKLLVCKADHEIIYYDLFELKNDRRDIVVVKNKFLKANSEYQVFVTKIEDLTMQHEKSSGDDDDLNSAIDAVKKEMTEFEVNNEECVEFNEKLAEMDVLIEPIQQKYNKALELAGLKHVRSAPSARVARPTTEVEVGGWSASEKSVGKVNEQSEVDKLKEEMKEMKKMMMEQAELIKALTNKD